MTIHNSRILHRVKGDVIKADSIDPERVTSLRADAPLDRTNEPSTPA